MPARRPSTGRGRKIVLRMAAPMRDDRGAALMITVVLVFLLLAFLGTWILDGTHVLVSGARTRAYALQAHHLAHSGLAWACHEVREGVDLDGDGLVGGIGSPDGSVRRPLGNGSLWVHALEDGETVTLTAFGSYQGITRSVRRVVEASQQGNLITIGTANYLGTDYNLIYEGELGGTGLVWLDHTRGPARWQHQVNWVNGLGKQLNVTLHPGYTTTINWGTGWRLPETPEQTAGYNITTSEMGHLYYESLGNSENPDRSGELNTGPFRNLMADAYWSGPRYGSQAYFFNFGLGWQSRTHQNGQTYAMAVRPGQVSGSGP